MKTGKVKIIVIILLLTSSVLYSQSRLKVSQMNPAFRKFIQERKHGKDIFAAPSPGLLNFNEYYKQKKSSGSKDFPLVYDLRNAGPGGTSLLTPVKNQSGCGACWAFATYGSVESVWKIMGLGDFDLSENNLKNCSGFELEPCEWGHHFMSTAYFIRGSGPVTEDVDPWMPFNQECTGGFAPEAYIPVSRYLPQDKDAFKETIMTTGAVYNTFHSESTGYQWINGHYTYCYQGSGTTTHAIAIAGWNDTITTACGQGAWICKNQYSENFGENGYFYIAYQDSLVLKYNAIWPEREEYNPGMYIYQIDEVGGWPFIGYEDSIAYGLIKFTATGNQIINRIGTYTVSFGTTLYAWIYSSFNGIFTDSLLTAIPEQYCDYPGFWQLNLPEPLRVDSGEIFYVKVKYVSPGCDFPMACEKYEEDYTDPFIETGRCWTREENGPWEAIGLGTEMEADLCIKVYAYDIVDIELRSFLEGAFDDTAMNTELNGLGLLPLSQPYNSEPWNYQGTETLAVFPEEAVDWVLVDLRDAPSAPEANESTVIARKAGIILSNGFIIAHDGGNNLSFEIIPADSLYVVINHRNHCQVMSSTGLIKTGNIYQYDFTTSFSKASGGSESMNEVAPGIWGMKAGDGNSDGVLSIEDIIEYWRPFAGESGYMNSDFNLDGQTDNEDKNIRW